MNRENWIIGNEKWEFGSLIDKNIPQVLLEKIIVMNIVFMLKVQSWRIVSRGLLCFHQILINTTSFKSLIGNSLIAFYNFKFY